MEGIDKSEVLRYLGHRGQEIGPELDGVIESAMAECQELAAPACVWRSFPFVREESGIRLTGAALTLPGADIARHLAGASACVLMAATLGIGLDMAIRRHGRGDLTRSLILDAAATALIEQVCDGLERKIAPKLGERQRLGSRFSPGYGDLPLTVQLPLLNVLEASKQIGLSCTPSLIMLPQKSVSAIAGVFPAGVEQAAPRGSCKACALFSTCQYRKDGISCGHPPTD